MEGERSVGTLHTDSGNDYQPERSLLSCSRMEDGEAGAGEDG